MLHDTLGLVEVEMRRHGKGPTNMQVEAQHSHEVCMLPWCSIG